MKYLLVLCLIFLVACAQQYAPQARAQQAPPQYVPPAPEPVSQGSPEKAVAGLGASQFTIHPYLVGNKDAASVRPGTPLVGKLMLKKALPGSPPITGDVTIFITAVYPTGDYELFGTDDIPNILPSNVLRFDHGPDVQAWTNDKFVANADINTQIRYIVFVKYHNDARYLQHTINVR